MFQTSRAHVDFSRDELETRLRSFQILIQQLNDYFLHNFYKTDQVITRHRKRIFLKTLKDQARAHESKLRKNILIQYNEFLSTLIEKPDLIRQIQIQVKIGGNPNNTRHKQNLQQKVDTAFTKRVVSGITGAVLLGASFTTKFLWDLSMGAWMEGNIFGCFTLLGVLGTITIIPGYYLYKHLTDKKDQFQIKDEIDYMISNPKTLDENKQLFDKNLKKIFQIEEISEILSPIKLQSFKGTDRTAIVSFYTFYENVEPIKNAINNILRLLKSKSKKETNDKELKSHLTLLDSLFLQPYERVFIAEFIRLKLIDLGKGGDSVVLYGKAKKTLNRFLQSAEQPSLPSQQPNV